MNLRTIYCTTFPVVLKPVTPVTPVMVRTSSTTNGFSAPSGRSIVVELPVEIPIGRRRKNARVAVVPAGPK